MGDSVSQELQSPAKTAPRAVYFVRRPAAPAKTAVLAKRATLAKTSMLVTHGTPPPGNLLVCEKTKAHQEKQPTRRQFQNMLEDTQPSRRYPDKVPEGLEDVESSMKAFYRGELALHGKAVISITFSPSSVHGGIGCSEAAPPGLDRMKEPNSFCHQPKVRRREQPHAVVTFLVTPPGGQAHRRVLGKFTTPAVNATCLPGGISFCDFIVF
ncbi:hypothetical protein P7K49_029996 [Saguinus oedipus]|uniref:Uncharacterized protein n=1 Tax=Saguinus oedipus TaxID=9490 RepID=A0ABQ9U8S4_SAGOE|nr:hypothetical protein P7K49_029996 [Saguinus oedipus]